MQRINLEEAAEFLDMNPDVLRRKAKKGLIPGKKPGKRWIFIKEHLADWISGRYPFSEREPQVVDLKIMEAKQCQSTNAEKRGTYNSPTQAEKEYKDLLGLK